MVLIRQQKKIFFRIRKKNSFLVVMIVRIIAALIGLFIFMTTQIHNDLLEAKSLI